MEANKKQRKCGVELPLVAKLKELGVEHHYGWGAVNEDSIKYSFDHVAYNLEVEGCTLSQLAQVVPLIFDIGYEGRFTIVLHDFYYHLKRYLERSLLDKLLTDFNEDNRQLVVSTLAAMDVWYAEEKE